MSLSSSDPENPEYEKKTPPLHSDDSDDCIVLSSERDIATHIVSVHDDPTLNPWTIRAFVIGLGLSAFGSVLGKSKFALFYNSLSGVEFTFEQRRYTTSNQYELVFFLTANLSLQIFNNSKLYWSRRCSLPLFHIFLAWLWMQ